MEVSYRKYDIVRISRIIWPTVGGEWISAAIRLNYVSCASTAELSICDLLVIRRKLHETCRSDSINVSKLTSFHKVGTIYVHPFAA